MRDKPQDDLPTVLVTHPTPRLAMYFGDRALQQLQQVARVRLNLLETDLEGQALAEAAQGCDVILAYRQTPVSAEVFNGLPHLRAVVRCAMDIRTIDVAAASASGVLITQASPGFMASVSEWVIGVMIDLSRSISLASAQYQHGRAVQPRMGRELRGARLGVIGYGHIGRYLCPLALALGMQVVVADPFFRVDQAGIAQVELDELLASADYVVCLAPANAQTENMMDARAFASMKRGAYFINASRGGLVDESALMAALDSGHLAGAAIDVGSAPDQMPSPAVARHPHVVATPHIAGLTPPAIEHQALEAVAQISAILQGRIPAGAVNAAHATRILQGVSA